MNRRLLVAATLTAAAVGAVIAAVPFLRSFAPNDRARAGLLEVDVADLGVGAVKTYDRPTVRVFLERPRPDEVLAFVVPLKGGLVLMPDEKWWRPVYACHDFGPENESGRLINGGGFRCRDANLDEWGKRYWLWDGAGRYIGPTGAPFEDIPRAKFERTTTTIRLRIP